jgi:holo-[acyl-carrier protein] synthase
LFPLRRPPATDPRRNHRGASAAGELPPGSAIGIDIAEVTAVAQSIAIFGQRYLDRVYTAEELAYCTAPGRDPAPHLAARFAAKEATFKALRQGDEPVDWRSVEVRRRPDGSCHIALYDGARALAARRGLSSFSVSMTHDGGYAAAIVVGGQARTMRTAPTPSPLSRARLGRRIPRGAYER